MNKAFTVVVDADMIIAQTDNDDPHHENAMKLSKMLINKGAQVLYPSTAIAEAVTHVQRVINSKQNAYDMAKKLTGMKAIVVEVDKEILSEALYYFSPTGSKNNTLFDCIVAAIAKNRKADAIFSFDKFYKKNGFKLVHELNK